MTVIALAPLPPSPRAPRARPSAHDRSPGPEVLRGALGGRRHREILFIGATDRSVTTHVRLRCDRLDVLPADPGTELCEPLGGRERAPDLVVLGPEVFRQSDKAIGDLAVRLDSACPRSALVTLTDCGFDLPGYDGDLAFASLVRATLRTWRTTRRVPGWRVARFDPLSSERMHGRNRLSA